MKHDQTSYYGCLMSDFFSDEELAVTRQYYSGQHEEADEVKILDTFKSKKDDDPAVKTKVVVGANSAVVRKIGSQQGNTARAGQGSPRRAAEGSKQLHARRRKGSLYYYTTVKLYSSFSRVRPPKGVDETEYLNTVE